MAHAVLTQKPVQRRPDHLLVKAADRLSLLVGILLLVFSLLAFLYTLSEGGPFYGPVDILCLFVTADGTLLGAVGWFVPAVRLTWWQVGVIVLGIGLGLDLGLQHVAYKDACCMFGYQIAHGYPFSAVVYFYLSDTPLSWNQVYEIMRQHPDQIIQQIHWEGMITDSVFYANLILIPVVILGALLRPGGRFARRS